MSDCRTFCGVTADDSTLYPVNATIADDVEDEWLRVAMATVSVTIIIIIIVLGNGLVIVAIAADRQLKGVQNWFIASLAVSDLLVGVFIMPLSLANELMGYWAFGDVLCQLWLSTDVLLCTASILNLCLISLDRYWSITRAISYLRKRTTRRAALMISVVWTLSAIICFPPLAGWSRPQPIVDGRPLCVLSEEPGYVLYSIIGSFYLPLGVMAVVYVKIYLAARWRARRHLKGAGGRRSGCVELQPTAKQHPLGGIDDHHARKATTATMSGVEPVQSSVDGRSMSQRIHGAEEIIANSGRDAIIVITHADYDAPAPNAADDMCAVSSDVCPSPSSCKQVYHVEVSVDRGSCVKPQSDDDGRVTTMEVMPSCDTEDNTSPVSSSLTPVQHTHSPVTPSPVHRVFVDEKKLLLTSVASNTSSNYRAVTTCQSNRPDDAERLEGGQLQPPSGRLSGRHQDQVSGRDDISCVCETEVERAKRKIARARERRATVVLGIVMVSFVGCWLPFFAVYPVSLLTGMEVPEPLFAVIFWLGYCNSALNPIIYTVFNRDFRRAFRKLLSCKRNCDHKVRRL